MLGIYRDGNHWTVAVGDIGRFPSDACLGQSKMKDFISSGRRRFLRSLAVLTMLPASSRPQVRQAPLTNSRTEIILRLREASAFQDCRQPVPPQAKNGDESSVPGYAGAFTKGLPHDQFGLVVPSAYGSLLHAMATGRSADFEAVERGSGMKLVNPESAFAYEMEGLDSHQLACAAAPSLSSSQAAAEMVELYWQALTRDVSFANYNSSPLIQAASADLGRLPAFQGPRQSNGAVSTDTIFRGPFSGCLIGPYISQFLLQPVPTLSTWVDQKYRVPVPGNDFLTQYPEWLLLQSGLPPYREYTFDPVPRYLCTARGLAEWVHYDFLYQAFHNAALILLNQSPESILNTNPYWNPTNPYKTSKVMTGFGTFGAPHVCSWLGRVTTAALQAAWYQKWSIHRRLRPEEFGGLLHATLTRAARHPIAPDLLGSAAVAGAYQANGTYLLPQAFPEGCPLHPAYPAGHATVSGACSVVLKAFFDEKAVVTDTVVANTDGTALAPYTNEALTVGGEINKLAWNIAMGRNFAGIHYRSDAMAGFALGELIAIAKLQDLVNIFTESFSGFQVTRLDGTPVTISKGNA